MTVRRLRGIVTEMFLRLCSRAPRTTREFLSHSPERYPKAKRGVNGRESQHRWTGDCWLRPATTDWRRTHLPLSIRSLNGGKEATCTPLAWKTGSPPPLRRGTSASRSSASSGPMSWPLVPFPAQAIRHYRELLELEPVHIEGRLHFARLLDRLEEANEAVDVLSEGLRRAPDQTEFLVLRGSILGRLQRYREADADLRRVLRLHPSHAPAQFELGLLLWRRGLVQEAAVSLSSSTRIPT